MRGQRLKYTFDNGQVISRQGFVWWICFSMWVYILQGLPKTRNSNSDDACCKVSARIKELAEISDMKAIGEKAVEKIWDDSRDLYPSAFEEARLFLVRENNLFGWRPARKPLDKTALKFIRYSIIKNGFICRTSRIAIPTK